MKIYTYGFGELDLLGEAEEGDPLVEVRERADGTLFAVLVNE